MGVDPRSMRKVQKEYLAGNIQDRLRLPAKQGFTGELIENMNEAADIIDEQIKERKRGAMIWQPIETAPKDRNVLVVTSRGMAVAFLPSDDRQFIEWWSINDFKNDPYMLRGPSPTHWMSLPEPPND